MEVLEQLRQEAERRASSPEGLLALADLLIADFNEVLDAKPTGSESFLTLDNLADFYHWLHCQDRSVYAVNMSYADFDKMRPQFEEVSPGKYYLWGAEMLRDPLRPLGDVRLVDHSGIYYHRQYWANPRARLYELLRVYVLAKRQYEYCKKQMRIHETCHYPHWSDSYHCEMRKRLNALQTTIDYQRAMVENLALTVPPDKMAQWKKEIGPTLQYGTGCLTQNYHVGYTLT